MTTYSLIDTEEIGSDPIKSLFLIDQFDSSVAEYEILNEQYSSTDNGYVNIVQEVEITLNAALPQSFTQTLLDQLGAAETSHLVHNTTIFIQDEDVAQSTVGNNTRYQSDAFSHYNIRNDEYERLSEVNNERIFPNYLLGALWKKEGPLQLSNTKIEEYYTMFNAIPSLVDSNILSEPPRINGYEFDNEEIAFNSNGFIDSALEEKTDYYKVLLNNFNEPRDLYASANTHVYVDFDYTQTDSTKTGNTPFFNRIKLPFANRAVPTVFPNGTLGEQQQTVNSYSPINVIFSQCQLSDVLLKSFRQSNSINRNFTVNGNEMDIKVYDILDLIENIDVAGLEDRSDEMFLKSPNEPLISQQNNPFLFFFYKLKLKGKMRNRNKTNLKTFEDLIVRGEPHKKENIGFKVVKRIQGRNTPIQTFYFANRVGLEDFVDTQVKFDRVYTYEVIALYAIYGSEYSYTFITLPDITLPDEERKFTIRFQNNPSIKIAELPVKTHTMRIVDPPPILPEISFFNQKTTKNMLKINFEHQDGNYVDEYNIRPIRSFAGNQEYLSKLNQYFNSDNVLMHTGKTSEGIYEIYRLEQPPKTIKDFENSLIAVVQSGVVYANGQRSKNGVFVDYIRHQQRYYYAFRVLTHRGNPSELSPVYEVEMYEDADETFMSYGIYEMEEREEFSRNNKMRKYLQIVPNFEHITPNDVDLISEFTNTNNALTALTLGLKDLDQKLFEYNNKNRYIKLRLESKNSGKKIDLNLMFDIKKQTN